MTLIVIFCLISLLSLSYFLLLKNTVFGISPKTGNYLGFFIFYNLIIYAIPSLLLLNLFPIENFWVAFKVKQESIFWISILIIFSILLYLLSLKFSSRFSSKYFSLNDLTEGLNKAAGKHFVRFTIAVCFFLIIVAWILFDVGHSFTLSLMENTSIGKLRFQIAEKKEVKAIKHLFIFITPLLASITASPIYRKKNIERTFTFLMTLLIASWAGSKGPVLVVFIIFLISYATFNNIKFNISSFFKMFLFSISLLILVYYVVLLQYPQLEKLSLFLDYFSQRVFVAQIIGVYEQFNLNLINSSYTWHGVPFASSVIEFPQFHKDLMMISEDRFDESNIGIKNTLFIAEAYGMGGWLLLLLSPLWIGINYALTFVWMVYLVNKYIFSNVEFTKRIIAISLFSYVSITGGFSDLMFFKITIMMTLLLFPFLYASNLLRRIRIRN